MFKHSYETESYVKCHILSRTRRSALDGTNPYKERYCFTCENKIESEGRVLLECPIYNDIRSELFSKVQLPHFDSLNKGAPVAQWVKRWTTDLADRVRSSLEVKSSQP